jgi:hypothetical protein
MLGIKAYGGVEEGINNNRRQDRGEGGGSDDDNSSTKANGTINPHRAEER